MERPSSPLFSESPYGSSNQPRKLQTAGVKSKSPILMPSPPEYKSDRMLFRRQSHAAILQEGKQEIFTLEEVIKQARKYRKQVGALSIIQKQFNKAKQILQNSKGLAQNLCDKKALLQFFTLLAQIYQESHVNQFYNSDSCNIGDLNQCKVVLQQIILPLIKPQKKKLNQQENTSAFFEDKIKLYIKSKINLLRLFSYFHLKNKNLDSMKLCVLDYHKTVQKYKNLSQRFKNDLKKDSELASVLTTLYLDLSIFALQLKEEAKAQKYLRSSIVQFLGIIRGIPESTTNQIFCEGPLLKLISSQQFANSKNNSSFLNIALGLFLLGSANRKYDPQCKYFQLFKNMMKQITLKVNSKFIRQLTNIIEILDWMDLNEAVFEHLRSRRQQLIFLKLYHDFCENYDNLQTSSPNITKNVRSQCMSTQLRPVSSEGPQKTFFSLSKPSVVKSALSRTTAPSTSVKQYMALSPRQRSVKSLKVIKLKSPTYKIRSPRDKRQDYLEKKENSYISFQGTNKGEVITNLDDFFQKKINQQFFGEERPISREEERANEKYAKKQNIYACQIPKSMKQYQSKSPQSSMISQNFSHRISKLVKESQKRIRTRPLFQNKKNHNEPLYKQKSSFITDEFLNIFKAELKHKTTEHLTKSSTLLPGVEAQIDVFQAEEEMLKQIVSKQKMIPTKVTESIIEGMEKEVERLFYRTNRRNSSDAEEEQQAQALQRKRKSLNDKSYMIKSGNQSQMTMQSSSKKGTPQKQKRPSSSYFKIKIQMLPSPPTPKVPAKLNIPETAFDKCEGAPTYRRLRLPKFKKPPPFLDTFIRVNKQNPIFRSAFKEFLPEGKRLKQALKRRGLKRAASTIMATIKLSSLTKPTLSKHSSSQSPPRADSLPGEEIRAETKEEKVRNLSRFLMAEKRIEEQGVKPSRSFQDAKKLQAVEEWEVSETSQRVN